MSLTAPDMKPWHLRAKIRRLNTDGSVLRETIFEEWWAAPKRYKVSYTEGDKTRIEYRTEQGRFFSGADVMQTFAPMLLFHPLPYPPWLKRVAYISKDGTVGLLKMQCLTEFPKDKDAVLPLTSSYCFGAGTPIVRFSLDSFGNKITWNRIVKFHGHYLAKEIVISTPSQEHFFNIDVDQVDPEPVVDEAEIAPPADAKPMPMDKLILPPGTFEATKLSGNNPTYSEAAKSIRAERTVVLQATINKDGVVTEIRAVSGSKVLQSGAIEGAKTWRFRPVTIEGEPIEAEVPITLNFKLGPRF